MKDLINQTQIKLAEQIIQMQQNDQQHVLTDKTGEKRYFRGKLLGSGGFAKCFEAVSIADKKTYALKVIPKKEINQKRKRYKLMLEIKLHRSLRHRNIVAFRDVFEDSENVYIVLEYCQNNTLKELVKRRKRITEYQAKVYMLQMVKALQFIHRNSIVHRDLKLGNILVNNAMQLKLCDFGLSTKINYQGEKKRTVCGTPNYIAPEILQEEGHSYESDIWSLGVILYALLFGKPPFESNTVEQTYQNIRNNKYHFPEIGVSDRARDLIRRVLLTDPARRLTLQQIRRHPFMQPQQQIPRTLPVYTLAIPPHNIPQTKLRTPADDLSVDRSIVLKRGDQVSQSISVPELQIKKKENVVDLVYAVDILYSNGNLGYLLSDGTMGIMFRDRSELSHRWVDGRVTYIKKNGDAPATMNHFPKKGIPHQLQEMYEKLTYFMEFFLIKHKQDQIKAMSERYPLKDLPIYVRKTLDFDNKHLIRLSNGCVELCFQDQTHLIMNRNDDKCLYYIDRKGIETIIEYDEIESIPDIKTQKKVKKFSNILASIWAHAAKQQGNEQQND